MNFTTYKEFELEVEYDYSPPEGDDWDSPYYPAEVEITSVKVLGQELVQHLDKRTLDLLSIEALEDTVEAWEQDQMDRAEARGDC